MNVNGKKITWTLSNVLYIPHLSIVTEKWSWLPMLFGKEICSNFKLNLYLRRSQEIWTDCVVIMG
jgi:hypothetical protein